MGGGSGEGGKWMGTTFSTVVADGFLFDTFGFLKTLRWWREGWGRELWDGGGRAWGDMGEAGVRVGSGWGQLSAQLFPGRVFLRYLWIFEGPQMVEGGLGERPLGMGEGELGETCGMEE